LKQFSQEKRGAFDREHNIFRALRAQAEMVDGMVRCIGSYEDESVSSYSIILEYGQFDLYTAIRNESPPITPSEIEGFWLGMLDISTALHQIHRLNLDSMEYDV
jgi:hypothetical protein